MPEPTSTISFRVTKTERAALELAAELAGTTVAAFVKARALATKRAMIAGTTTSAGVIPPDQTTGYAPDLIDLNAPPCEDADILEPAGPRTDLTPGQWKASADEKRRRDAIGKRPHAGPKKAKTPAAEVPKSKSRQRPIAPRTVSAKKEPAMASVDCHHPIGRRIGDTCVVCGTSGIKGKR